MVFVEAESHLQGKLHNSQEFRLLDRAAFKKAHKSLRTDDIYICVREITDTRDDTQMSEIQLVHDLLQKGIRPLLVLIYQKQINKLDMFMSWLNQKSMFSVFHLLHQDFLDEDYIRSILRDRTNAMDFSNFVLADSKTRDPELIDDLYDLMDALQGTTIMEPKEDEEGSAEESSVASEEVVHTLERAVNLITDQEATVSRVHAIEDKSEALNIVTEELVEVKDKLYNIEKEYETRLRDAAASQLAVDAGDTSIGNFVRFNPNTLKFKGRMIYFKCLDNLIYFKTMIAAFNDYLKTPTNTGRAANAVHSRIIVLDYWRPSLKIEYGDCEVVTAKTYRAEQDRIQRSKKPIILTSVNHVLIRSICEDHYGQGDGILIFVDCLGYPETLFMYNQNEFYVASSIGVINRYEKENDFEIASGRIITRAVPTDARYTDTIGLPQIVGVAGTRLRDRIAKVKGIPNTNSSRKDVKVLVELANSIRDSR